MNIIIGMRFKNIVDFADKCEFHGPEILKAASEAVGWMLLWL